MIDLNQQYEWHDHEQKPANVPTHTHISVYPHRGPHDEFIITQIKPNAPTHRYIGVNVNGDGAQYKLGSGRNFRVLGKVDSNHPALAALQRRAHSRYGIPADQSETISNDYKKLVNSLLDAVDNDDTVKAKSISTALRQLS